MFVATYDKITATAKRQAYTSRRLCVCALRKGSMLFSLFGENTSTERNIFGVGLKQCVPILYTRKIEYYIYTVLVEAIYGYIHIFILINISITIYIKYQVVFFTYTMLLMTLTLVCTDLHSNGQMNRSFGVKSSI